MRNEIELLQRQLNANNNQTERLLTIMERIRRDNSFIVNRLNTIYRDSYSRDWSRPREPSHPRDVPSRSAHQEHRQPIPQEPRTVPQNEEIDIMFYLYLPRNTILTDEILERETTVTTFQNIETPNNLSCPISLVSFQPSQSVTMINNCRHIFDSEQLRTWFEDKTTCPVCRYNLQTQNVDDNLVDSLIQILNRNI